MRFHTYQKVNKMPDSVVKIKVRQSSEVMVSKLLGLGVLPISLTKLDVRNNFVNSKQLRNIPLTLKKLKMLHFNNFFFSPQQFTFFVNKFIVVTFFIERLV